MDNNKNPSLLFKENIQVKDDKFKEQTLSPKKSFQQKIQNFENKKRNEEQDQISFNHDNSNISSNERVQEAVRHNSSNLQIKQEAQLINRKANIIGNIAQSNKKDENEKG